MILLILAVPLVIILGVSIVNAITFPRLRLRQVETTPSVGVLIPARNEAEVIGDTITRHTLQDYPNFSLKLLDDASDDGTGNIARQVGGERLQILTGQPLPAGWLGKNWACHQLAQAADAEILIFTDADVRWVPGALAAVIALMEAQQADMLTVWPTQATVTWPERWVVPLMSLAIIGYLPEFMVRLSAFPAFAAANGQCIVIRRETYDAIGGHAAVKANIVEDVTLAKRVKQAGYKLVMADGQGLINCRMYDGWPSVRDGFAKNILAGHGNSIPFLLFSTIFHWGIFVVPWLALLFTPWAFGLILLGLASRAISALMTQQRIIDSLFLPLSVLLMTLIAFRSIAWQLRYGGPQWKGRTIPIKA